MVWSVYCSVFVLTYAVIKFSRLKHVFHLIKVFWNALTTWNFYRSLFHACHTVAFKICYTFTVFSVWCSIPKAALCCWLKCLYFQLAVNLEKVGKLCSWHITMLACELYSWCVTCVFFCCRWRQEILKRLKRYVSISSRLFYYYNGK